MSEQARELEGGDRWLGANRSMAHIRVESRSRAPNPESLHSSRMIDPGVHPASVAAIACIGAGSRIPLGALLAAAAWIFWLVSPLRAW
jgi:hypothetical protein